jgi:DNA ligase-1
MSEKFDGVRAYWTGQELISRYSKQILCPDWFIEGLPKLVSLDGELWLGYGTFELLNGILGSVTNPLWKNASYMIFDFPSSKEIYENRINNLKKLNLPSHARIVDIVECRGNDHLRKHFENILERKGEGVMVNKYHSLYTPKRISTLLKVKVLLSLEY